MYICMCVCMYVYMCVCMYICMYIYIYVYVCIYVCMYVCMYVYIMYVSMYVRTYVCMYVCMYVCIMYVSMYVCMYYVQRCSHGLTWGIIRNKWNNNKLKSEHRFESSALIVRNWTVTHLPVTWRSNQCVNVNVSKFATVLAYISTYFNS